MIIRRLGPDDVGDYRRIRLSALQTTPEAFGSSYAAEAAQPDAFHGARLTSSAVFAAYVAAEIVGVLGCKRHEGEKEAHKGFLWGFYVEPRCRRSGIAATLLEASLRAAEMAVEQVHLTVVADNRPAIALYERFGFRPYGLERRALKWRGAYADEVLMALVLAGRPLPAPLHP